MKNLIPICLILAFVAAVFYFLIGFDVISVPATDGVEGPAGWAYMAGGCYLLGSMLLLLRKRWLWIIGLIANTLVIIIFFTMHSQHTAILTSLPGLGTKIAQVLLEVGLVYLIATFQRKAQPAF